MDSAQDTETAHALVRHLLGTDILTSLSDPKTLEVRLNADGGIWHQRLGEPPRQIGTLEPAAAMALAGALAGTVGKKITRECPYLETELVLDGSRVSVQVPPIVAAPTACIRKHASAVFTLDELCTDAPEEHREAVMDHSHVAAIRQAVAEQKNILVVGGTKSGKTTLINGIIDEITRQHAVARPIIIEDTLELQCNAKDQVRYKTSEHVSMQQLLRLTLRMSPDIIIVGEIRGPEALDLLDAWATGHRGGAASIHADSAAIGVSRLVLNVSRNTLAPRPIEPLVAQAVDVIVNIQRVGLRRRVQDILALTDHTGNTFHFERLA